MENDTLAKRLIEAVRTGEAQASAYSSRRICALRGGAPEAEVLVWNRTYPHRPVEDFTVPLVEEVLSTVPAARNSIRNQWKPGDRIERPLYSGSYPAAGPYPQGVVVEINDYLLRHEDLVVQFDGEEPRSINPDVLRHARKDS